ncbi:MAG: hypothetical protein A2Y86_05175 [Candidatus Aminicenantes bacterium RBG_13_62_12]|nr:MAG: hypothetical protein A2Y86_05175 [Candidatus Aminicenantes bacterium RBG_13_62_12]
MNDLLISEVKRQTAIKYLWRWIGTPYKFGGDDFSSFDCSGLIVEILQAVGSIPHGVDYTADGLMRLFLGKIVSEYGAWKEGCLVFYLKGGEDADHAIAIHVEMMIDKLHVVGASGGGSKTLTLADAITQNAFVKIRPFGYRQGPFVVVDPFMPQPDGPGE